MGNWLTGLLYRATTYRKLVKLVLIILYIVGLFLFFGLFVGSDDGNAQDRNAHLAQQRHLQALPLPTRNSTAANSASRARGLGERIMDRAREPSMKPHAKEAIEVGKELVERNPFVKAVYDDLKEARRKTE